MLASWQIVIFSRVYPVINRKEAKQAGSIIGRVTFATIHEKHSLWPIIASSHQGPVSKSDKTSYRKVSQSLDAARFVFRIVRSIWNLAGTSAALLPRGASQISKRYEHFHTRSRAYETLRDLTIRRLIVYWNGAQVVTAIHLKIRHPWISSSGAWSSNELQRLDCMRRYQDNSSNNDYRVI